METLKQTESFELITKDARGTFKTRAEAEAVAKVLESVGISTIILPSKNAPTNYSLRRSY